LSQTIERHEKSKSHFSSLKSLVDLKKSIKSGRTMDTKNENLIRLERKRWTSVIERIIYAI